MRGFLRVAAAGLAIAALAPFPAARAEEDAPQPPARADHMPEFCEFTISFPEAPYLSHHCEDAAGTKCYTAASFTRVYALESALNVKVSCNPVAPEMAARYTEEVMKKTLESMAKDRPVGKYTMNASTKDWGKAATLFGQGTKGVTPTLYVAQIWIGKASIFTVEGELSGAEQPDSDKLFSDILKSIRPLSAPQLPEPEAEKK